MLLIGMFAKGIGGAMYHGRGIFSSPTAWAATALALALGVASCDAAAPVEKLGPIEFHVTDSTGVRIAETSGGAMRLALAWTVDDDPDLQLGGAESLGPELFFRIQGARSLSGGVIVVLDGSSRELRWFDETGSHLRSLGEKGAGPGEFEEPSLLVDRTQGHLLVFDQRLRRFTEIEESGEAHRILDLRADGSNVITGAIRGMRGDKVLNVAGSGDCIEAEYCESEVLVIWRDLRTGTADTLETFPRKRHRIRDRHGLPFAMSGPFDPIVSVAMGPAGPIVTGGPEPQLKLFTESGQLEAVFRVNAPERVPTRSELDFLIDRQLARDLPAHAVRAAVARMGVPNASPAFQRVLLDEMGWYWVQIYSVESDWSSPWLVFDPEGRARGTIEMPAGLRVNDIARDHVIGVWQDEHGVEYIRRHRMQRSSP